MATVSRRLLRSLVSRRSFHLSSRLNIDPKTAEEIRIPVPWGYIAGKLWGEKTGQPIIALHGFLDNLSSFDNLCPLLDVPSVLCLEVHGHGQSSHIPNGMPLYYADYILHFRYLLKHLYKWDKDLVLMGHSFGSSVIFNYAAIYPEEVSKMINIDCGRYINASSLSGFIKETRKSLDGFLDTEKIFDIKAYNFDDCVNHMMKVRNSLKLPVSQEKCILLAIRGTSNLGNGKYYFSHDRRFRNSSLGRNSFSYNLALASRIKCSVLNIRCTGRLRNEDYLHEEEKHVKVMNEYCPSFFDLVLEGSHHIHLENPKAIAPHINKFLNS
ncbi:probable serine hydrolase isoform X2 [Rhodnius prolixus]|uniref:probable serine hydrolase isoform X2 n=1 Tax=Rhodnius prolixus TaxID=13249 RepID=UPI003D18BA7C